MTFDLTRYWLAHTIAKNEGVANPNRVAILPSMLNFSMPLSLVMTKIMAQREAANQPAASTSPTIDDIVDTLKEELVGKDYQYAKGYLTALNYSKGDKSPADLDSGSDPDIVTDLAVDEEGAITIFTNPGFKMPSLVGLTLSCAISYLQISLRWNGKISIAGEENDAALVSEHTPEAGKTVTTDTAVEFTVPTGIGDE